MPISLISLLCPLPSLKLTHFTHGFGLVGKIIEGIQLIIWCICGGKRLQRQITSRKQTVSQTSLFLFKAQKPSQTTSHMWKE